MYESLFRRQQRQRQRNEDGLGLGPGLRSIHTVARTHTQHESHDSISFLFLESATPPPPTCPSPTACQPPTNQILALKKQTNKLKLIITLTPSTTYRTHTIIIKEGREINKQASKCKNFSPKKKVLLALASFFLFCSTSSSNSSNTTNPLVNLGPRTYPYPPASASAPACPHAPYPNPESNLYLPYPGPPPHLSETFIIKSTQATSYHIMSRLIDLFFFLV